MRSLRNDNLQNATYFLKSFSALLPNLNILFLDLNALEKFPICVLNYYILR